MRWCSCSGWTYLEIEPDDRQTFLGIGGHLLIFHGPWPASSCDTPLTRSPLLHFKNPATLMTKVSKVHLLPTAAPQGGLCHRHALIVLTFRRDRRITSGYQAWGLGPGLLGKEKLTGKSSNLSSRWLFLKLGIAWDSPQVSHLKCTGNSSTLHLIEAAFLTTQAAINDNWSYRKDYNIHSLPKIWTWKFWVHEMGGYACYLPFPPVNSVQCAMQCVYLYTVQFLSNFPSFRKKSWHTSLWHWHHLITKYWVQNCWCFILLFKYRLSDFISYFTLSLLWVDTLRSVPIGHLIEISQRRGKVSDFPPHCLCFTFMQVQLNTSLLLDGIPTYIAYLHWFLVVAGFLSLIHPIK